MKEWIGIAATLDRAVERGLASLGLSRDQVDVKVLEEESSGLLSMFGYRRVKVRVQEKVRRVDRGGRFDWDNGDERPDRSTDRRGAPRGRKEDRADDERPAPSRPERTRPENIQPKPKEGNRPRGGEKDKNRTAKGRPAPTPVPASPLKQKPKNGPMPSPRVPRIADPIEPEVLLTQWKGLLSLEDLSWTFHPVVERRIPVELKTAKAERLGANGGKPLEAFEYLFNLVSSGGDREKPWVSFHLEGFASTDETRGVDKAVFAAFQVRRTGKEFHLDPMSPGQRRAVHQALAHHPDVLTSSEGEGPARHVVVKPKINLSL